MDKIILILGDDTVARIECRAGFTLELFQAASNMHLDYAVAFDHRGGILWVADGMSEDEWSPEGTSPEDTRKETLERFPELNGKW